MRTKGQLTWLEHDMENILSRKRNELAANARRIEIKETIKDAVGAFAIIVIFYVGLFIPSL